MWSHAFSTETAKSPPPRLGQKRRKWKLEVRLYSWFCITVTKYHTRGSAAKWVSGSSAAATACLLLYIELHLHLQQNVKMLSFDGPFVEGKLGSRAFGIYEHGVKPFLREVRARIKSQCANATLSSE